MRSLLFLVVMLAVVGCDTPTTPATAPSTYVLMQDRYGTLDLHGIFTGRFTLEPGSGTFKEVLGLSTGERRESQGDFMRFDGKLWLHDGVEVVLRCPLEDPDESLTCTRSTGHSYLYHLKTW